MKKPSEEKKYIQQYLGVPRKLIEPKEISKWQKFLRGVIPLLGLVEDYYRAKVAKEVQQARGQYLDNELKEKELEKKEKELEKANKTIELAGYFEEEEELENPTTVAESEEGLDEALENVINQLKKLKINFGVEIKAEIGEMKIDFDEQEKQ